MKYPRGVCLAFVLIFLLGVGSPRAGGAITEAELIQGAQREGKVLWYTSSPTKSAEHISSLFAKKYNVKLEFVRLGGLATVQRVFAEQERKVSVCDVVGPTGATEGFPQMKKKGWLAKIDDLPEWKNIWEHLRDKDGVYLMLNSDAVGMIYNQAGMAGLVLPRTVGELADPKWKGKIVVGDPAVSGTALTWGRFVIQHPQLGQMFFEKLRANNVLIVGQTGQISDTVARGARIIAAMQQEYEYVQVMQKGVGWITPEDGFVITPRPAAVLANAPRPMAARLLMNFLMGKEIQDLMIQEGHSSSRKDVDSKKYFPWKPDIQKGWQPDWEAITEADSKEMIQKISKGLKGM